MYRGEVVKKIFVLFISIFVVGLFAEDRIWNISYKDALEQSKGSSKKVMILFTQDGCSQCTVLKETVLKDSSIQKSINKFFIPVEIDIRNEKIPKGFKVFGTPMVFFVKSDKQILKTRVIGATTPDGFRRYLGKAVMER